MRISILKLNVMTDKMLEQKLEAAKTEARKITNRQMANLLHRNAKMSLALRNLAGGKKRNPELKDALRMCRAEEKEKVRQEEF